MASFGKKLRECREDKALSQQELAKILKTSHSVIGRYERDEMSPSIEVVKKLAAVLDTTVGYLLAALPLLLHLCVSYARTRSMLPFATIPLP